MHSPFRAIVTLGAAMLLLGAGESPNVDLQLAASTAIPAEVSVSTVVSSTEELTETSTLSDQQAFTLPEAGTLSEMVTVVRTAEVSSLDEDARCLASAVYYESKGEPLAGQLAVAQVVLNRVQDGRFGDDVCAVIKAPKQFGFVKGGSFTQPAKSRQWDIAKAIALIAIGNGWPELAPDATHFHATRVNPRWNLERIATIGAHIFYR